MMRVIVNGDTSNPSVISYGHGNRTRYHGIEIGREVAAIHREAFAGSSVSSVFIPDTVARVLERECFKCCYALETVVLGGQLRVVPASAFQFCDALQSVDLSGSSLTAIKKVAFCNCESLKKIVIPKQVAEINARAFQGCTSLETVDFERDSCIQYIEERAFQDCRSLAKICFPGSIRNIEDFCFNRCRGLRLVIFEPRTPENDADPTRMERITKWSNGRSQDLSEDLFVSCVAFRDCRRLYGLVVLRPAWFDEAQLRHFSGLRVVYASSENIEDFCAFLSCDSNEECRLMAWERSAPSGLDTRTPACSRAGAPVAVTSSNPDDEETDLKLYVEHANSPPHLSVGMRQVQEIVRESMYWCIRSFGSWTPCRREWVRTVMMVAHRLYRDRTILLPVLPNEVWYMILGFIQEKHLKVTLSWFPP